MAPRGLKAALKRTTPAKLVGRTRVQKGFRSLGRDGKPTGPRLRGLTKRLEERLWSDGSLPSAATRSQTRRRGWGGADGGRRRGSAVDAQISRCGNAGAVRPQNGQYVLTRVVFAALAEHGLQPVLAQRATCCTRARLGTAADLVCYNASTKACCVVELKCGFSGDRTATALGAGGKPQCMKAPLNGAADCILHRHLAQLAATCQMLSDETALATRLEALGLEPDLEGALLYVNDDQTDLYPLPQWWRRRGKKLVAAMR